MNFESSVNMEMESHKDLSNQSVDGMFGDSSIERTLNFEQRSDFTTGESLDFKSTPPVLEGLENVSNYSTHVLEMFSRSQSEFFSIESEVLEEAWRQSYDSPSTESGGGVQEVIIDTDDRVRVKDTTRFPFKAICQLIITDKDGKKYVGTGWFVSPGTIITAGHNVYLHKKRSWAKSILVTPGKNGNQNPFGSVRATSFKSVRGWVRDKKPGCDYAAIHLPKSRRPNIGNQYFKVVQATPQQLRGKYLNLSGYPGDKGGKTQWYHARPIKKMTRSQICYEMDTKGGCSGAPVWWTGRNGQRYAVGIHAYGSSSGNSATRFIPPVYNNVMNWLRKGL